MWIHRNSHNVVTYIDRRKSQSMSVCRAFYSWAEPRGVVGQRGILNLVCTLSMHRQNITCFLHHDWMPCRRRSPSIINALDHPAATVSLTQCRYHIQLVLLEERKKDERNALWTMPAESNPHVTLGDHDSLIIGAKGYYVRIGNVRALWHSFAIWYSKYIYLFPPLPVVYNGVRRYLWHHWHTYVLTYERNWGRRGGAVETATLHMILPLDNLPIISY